MLGIGRLGVGTLCAPTSNGEKGECGGGDNSRGSPDEEGAGYSPVACCALLFFR